ncbi:hypothetical protein VNI00_005332 [Paramarasmius palmivorus]|uniref:Uncharacterized protein n=1 Tax=Paramarasmius palmivorus TaxID=297713 RepID=A0AAW0DFQ4_9AGAR
MDIALLTPVRHGLCDSCCVRKEGKKEVVGILLTIRIDRVFLAMPLEDAEKISESWYEEFGDRFVSDTAGSKRLLYFPVRGAPFLVSVSRLALLEQDYSAFVPVFSRGKNGQKGKNIQRRVYIATAQLQNFLMVYVEQGSKNRSPVNDFITGSLQAVGSGFNRQWKGSVLVDFDNKDDLSTVDGWSSALNVVQYDDLATLFHLSLTVSFDSYIHLFYDFLRLSGRKSNEKVQWKWIDPSAGDEANHPAEGSF